MRHGQPHQNRLRTTLILTCLVIIAVLTLSTHRSQDSNSDSAWTKQWKQVAGLQQARRAHMTASNQGFIYALGGISDNDETLASVEFAAILSNGDLSTWKATTEMPLARIYAAAVIVEDYLYVIGGGTGATGSENQPTANVIKANILDNGHLGVWQPTQSLSTARRGLKVFPHENRIFAIGGYNGRFLKSTEFTSISTSTEKELLPWKQAEQRAHLDRYIHAAAGYKDTLYVLGGHQQHVGKMTTGDVESSHINGAGELEPWFIEKARLNQPRFIASAFAQDRYIYILGGHNGGNRLKSVEYAPIYTDGHIGQFEFTTSLKVERSACSVTVSGDFVYVVGGMSNKGTLHDVELSQVAKNGHLGNPK